MSRTARRADPVRVRELELACDALRLQQDELYALMVAREAAQAAAAERARAQIRAVKAEIDRIWR